VGIVCRCDPTCGFGVGFVGDDRPCVAALRTNCVRKSRGCDAPATSSCLDRAPGTESVARFVQQFIRAGQLVFKSNTLCPCRYRGCPCSSARC
jgi:hypothetical protein